jgi:hypothetical protein
MRMVLFALAFAACAKSHVDEAPSRVAVIPDSITSQLGTVGFVMAVDLHRLDLGAMTAMIPDDPPCLHDVLKNTGTAVLTQGADTWQGYVTGLAQPLLRDCIGKFAPMFAGTVTDRGSGFELVVDDTPATFAWHGELATITKGSNAPHAGDPPSVILDLLARVPRDAKGSIVSSGFPQYKIKSVVAWLETTPTTWTFTVHAEGSTQDMAKPWVEGLVTGFSTAATAKGVTIDPSWFVITGTPTATKLVATIPIAALQTPAPK